MTQRLAKQGSCAAVDIDKDHNEHQLILIIVPFEVDRIAKVLENWRFGHC